MLLYKILIYTIHEKYMGKYKKVRQKNKFKISAQIGMKNLSYLTDCALYWIFKIILNIS